jgi:hypothetical protein
MNYVGIDIHKRYSICAPDWNWGQGKESSLFRPPCQSFRRGSGSRLNGPPAELLADFGGTFHHQLFRYSAHPHRRILPDNPRNGDFSRVASL